VTLGDVLRGADSFALIAVFSKYSDKMDQNEGLKTNQRIKSRYIKPEE